MDFRLCTLCIVAVGIFLMVDQLKAEEPSEATDTEPQETAWSDSNYEVKKRSKMKENYKLEKTYQPDGMKKKNLILEDMNAFNKNKKNHKDQKSLKKERKHVFEKNKVEGEIYSNGYVDTPNDERNVKQERNTKGRRHKFSDDQTVEVTHRNAKLSKKQGKKKNTEECSEYGNKVKEVKKYDCMGGKKHKKGRCSSTDEMQTSDSCGSNVKHSKYMKKMKTKSEHLENSVMDTSENLDDWSVPVNSESCETADNTENKLRGRNGRKIKRTYVVEDEYEAGTNEGYSVEIDEEEDVVLYNSEENEPSQSKGKIRRYIVEEEFIEDSTIDE